MPVGPGGNVPGGGGMLGGTPGEPMPASSLAQDHIPMGPAPCGPPVRELNPGGSMPGGGTPGCPTSGKTMPGAIIPGGPVPGGGGMTGGSEPSMPGGGMPGGGMPGGGMPGGGMPGDPSPPSPMAGDHIPGEPGMFDPIPGGPIPSGENIGLAGARRAASFAVRPAALRVPLLCCGIFAAIHSLTVGTPWRCAEGYAEGDGTCTSARPAGLWRPRRGLAGENHSLGSFEGCAGGLLTC